MAKGRMVDAPYKVGPLAGATHFGESGTAGEGPYIQLWLRVGQNTILDAAWNSNGCPTSISCARALVAVLARRELDRVALLNADDVVNLVGGLPKSKRYCADLAITALHRAIEGKMEHA